VRCLVTPLWRGGAGGVCYTPGPDEPRSTPTIQDNPNWHRHRNACTQYRERWTVDDEAGDEGCALLYQIICLQNTPPITSEEQALCMQSRKTCWRLEAPETAGRRGRSRARDAATA
jgi:hypothetical protein